jgi:hypothetical protein
MRWTILAACAWLAACSSYYRVLDPSSGNEYYTDAIDLTPRGGASFNVLDPSSGRVYATPDVARGAGAVSFKDASTGSRITLQDSQITRIPAEVYRQGVGAASAGR